MLIIARAGLKSSGLSSFLTPAEGSINNPYYASQSSQPNIQDIESISREDDIIVVQIRKATEIHLDDLKPVSEE